MEGMKKDRRSGYEQLARVGKALSSPVRLEVLDLLRNGERTVECLANTANLGVANVSRHLQVLRGAGLVKSEKNGLYVTYQIADPCVCEFFMAMCRLAEARLAEFEKIVKQISASDGEMAQVDLKGLMRRARNKEVTLIDVRPREEYQAGHIPGALSIPVAEIEQHLDSLSSEKEIVAYCRGPYCLLATEAVKLLRKKGFRARRMREGIHEWRASSIPVPT